LFSEKIISEERFQRLPFAEESSSPFISFISSISLSPFRFLHLLRWLNLLRLFDYLPSYTLLCASASLR
jgi:hypothetical protein